QRTGGGGVTVYHTISDNTNLEAHISYASITADETKNKLEDTWTNLDKIEDATTEDTSWYGDFAFTHQLPGLAEALGINRVRLKYGVQAGYKNRDFGQSVLDAGDAQLTDG